MSKVYLIADTHFGHENALRFRPQFKTIKEHDSFIVNNWNKTVTKRDTVWVLGDFSFTKDRQFVNVTRARLNGYIKFVQGNHDLVVPDDVRLMPPLVVYKGAWLSHAPIHPDELRGKANYHGHTHSKTINDERYKCFSCEQVNYTPKLFEVLEADAGKDGV